MRHLPTPTNQKLFNNQPLYLVAGGSSFTPQQLELLSGKEANIVTINNSFKKIPDAAICYAGDFIWWQHNHEIVRSHTMSACWTGNKKAAIDYKLNFIECRLSGVGLGTRWIVHGGNSGYQALNLAIIWGANPIILLGYDCRYGINGERHHYEDHPKHFGANADGIKSWLHHFELGAKALEQLTSPPRVINCSPGSAITGFERGDLQDWV